MVFLRRAAFLGRTLGSALVAGSCSPDGAQLGMGQTIDGGRESADGRDGDLGGEAAATGGAAGASGGADRGGGDPGRDAAGGSGGVGDAELAADWMDVQRLL